MFSVFIQPIEVPPLNFYGGLVKLILFLNKNELVDQFFFLGAMLCHGTELKFCPKCGKQLKPGKHHVGCSAGKSTPRQAAKRQRQMSSTTESDWVSQTLPASLDEQSDRKRHYRARVDAQ